MLLDKNHFNWIVFVCVFICCALPQTFVYGFFDPLTLTAGAGAAFGAWKFGDFIKEQTYCRLNECCNEQYIPGNITKLASELQSKIFGQHIVIKQLVPALEAHFSESKSRKPLVISFHGPPGTGKNYVAEMIANSIYAKGLSSKYVHKYFGRVDFSSNSETEANKNRITKEVRDALYRCPRSLFIFDEVDHVQAGVFDSLSSLVDYKSHIDGNDNTQAIFLFLSNTAGVQISDRLGELLNAGVLREDTRLSDFEQTLQKAAYNLDGGMKKSSLIEAHVIDHFLPFLPLEKSHVSNCIEAEFARWNKSPNPKIIESAIKKLVNYDRKFGIFSITGCKNIEKRVAIEVKMGNV